MDQVDFTVENDRSSIAHGNGCPVLRFKVGLENALFGLIPQKFVKGNDVVRLILRLDPTAGYFRMTNH